MTTVTEENTIQDELDRSDLNTLADAIRLLALGRMLKPVKVTFSGLTSSAAIDITAQDSTDNRTINQGLDDLGSSEALPAILMPKTIRVVAGTLAAGPGVFTDSGGTPTAIAALAVHVVTLSDDGKTITFQAAVTGFVLEYIPRSLTDLSTLFRRTGVGAV